MVQTNRQGECCPHQCREACTRDEIDREESQQSSTAFSVIFALVKLMVNESDALKPGF